MKLRISKRINSHHLGAYTLPLFHKYENIALIRKSLILETDVMYEASNTAEELAIIDLDIALIQTIHNNIYET